jgi:hypothetical protein
MNRQNLDQLDSTRTYWVASVVSPERNWAGAPGCRRGARFLVDGRRLRASQSEFLPFESQQLCLQWIMSNRMALNRSMPGVRVRAVPLARWLLGLD